MWPFSRRRDTGRAAAEPTSVLRQVSSAAPWREVAPIAASVTPIPLTLAPQRFADGLASWQPPQPYLGSLGHALSPDAPSGAVGGLASTIDGPVAASDGPSMVLRQTPPPPAPAVQRSVAQPMRPTLPTVPPAPVHPPDETGVAAGPAPQTAPELVLHTAPAVTAQEPASQTAPELVLRTAPAVAAPVQVSRLRSADSVDVPVLRLPSVPAAAPIAQPQSGDQSDVGDAGSAPLLSAATEADAVVAGQADVPLVPPLSATPAPAVQRAVDGSGADATLPLATAPVRDEAAAGSAAPGLPMSPTVAQRMESVPAPLLGDDPPRPRRLGLGEPLHQRPDATAPPHPDATTPDAPPLPLQRRPDPRPPSGGASRGAETSAAQPAPTLGLGAPLSAVPAPPAPETSPTTSETSAADATDSAAAGDTSMVIQPLRDEPAGAAAPEATRPPTADADAAEPATAPLLGGVLPEPPAAAPPAAGTATDAAPAMPLQRSPAHDSGGPGVSTTGLRATPTTGSGAPTTSSANGAATTAALPRLAPPLSLTGPTPTVPVQRIAPLLAGLGTPGATGAAAPGTTLVQRRADGPTPAPVVRAEPPRAGGVRHSRTVDTTTTTTATTAPASLWSESADPLVYGSGLGAMAVQPLRTLPVTAGAPAVDGAVQRAMGAWPATPLPQLPAAPHLPPAPQVAVPWSAGRAPGAAGPGGGPPQSLLGGARAVAPAGEAPPGTSTLQLLAGAPRAPEAPGSPGPVGPLAIPQQQPAAPQEAQGLTALLSQGAAVSDGDGIAFRASEPHGGDGDVSDGGVEQADAGREPGGPGLGHPRTWDAETLDELSRRLYSGISRRIKQELRADRERTGRLMDLRR